MICTPHRGSSLTCAHLSCPYMKCVFLFDFELSIPSNFLFFSFSFNLLQFLLHFFHNLEGSSNTAYFAQKEMESTDESYLLTTRRPQREQKRATFGCCRNIFPGFTTLQLYGKVTDLLSRLGETPETFTGRILFISMFNDISCDGKDNEEECLANAEVVSIFAKKFGKGQWSFIGPGSEKKWYSMEENSPQRIWDHIAEKMLVEFAESGCPIFRATTPLSRGNSSVSTEQWRPYVKNLKLIKMDQGNLMF